MWRSARAAALGLACTAMVGAATAGTSAPIEAPGLDFEGGLAGWQATSVGGSGAWTTDAAGGRTAVRWQPGPNASGRLARAWTLSALDLARPYGDAPGQRVTTDFELWLGADVTSGSLTVDVLVQEGAATRTLASATLDVQDAPRERWFRWSSGLATAGLASASDALRIEWSVDTDGEVRLDEGVLRREGRRRAADFGGGFEGATSDWTSDPWSDVPHSDEVLGGYRGTGCARLDWNDGVLQRSVALEGSGLCAGLAVEAGAWVRLSSSAAVGSSPDAHDEVALDVVAVDAATATRVVVASGAWRPVVTQRGRWVWVAADALDGVTVPASATELSIEITSTVEGEVRVDEVALGQQASVDGNPGRMVGLNYLGRYRSPEYPLSGGELLDPAQNWRNWRWVTPPAPDASFTGFAHDPDCSTSVDCMRSNGRRDLAVGTEFGEDDLPLIGAYDSRDEHVVRYHLELAEALGIDFMVYEYLGHELAWQHRLSGNEPINEDCYETLLDLLDEPVFDLKTAVMYEPKVHMQGWVANEPTMLDKKAGIAYDLAYLIEAYGDRRGVLRRDGRVVVFLFRDRSCNPSGTQCLDADDWHDILDWVEADTGERPFLLADAKPEDGGPFGGMSRWDLVSRDILKYRTFADAAAGTPTSPKPDSASLELHCKQRHGLGRDWELEDPWRRLHVPIVWPGFDDTGVAGWSLPNLTGEDGAPLGVRVADPLGGAFYRTTVTSALESGADWVQIATWNDWNESTRIEPAWDPGFSAAPFASLVLDARVQRQVFGRALETQAWIAAYKGTTAQPALVPRIAMRYLYRAATDASVTQYD